MSWRAVGPACALTACALVASTLVVRLKKGLARMSAIFSRLLPLSVVLSFSTAALATTPVAPNDPVKPVCSTLTDSFCDQLWNGQNNGNMAVFDGDVKFGKSKKSGESYIGLIDLRALADSGPRLPADLAPRAAPILKRLGELLDQEATPGTWTGAERFAWQNDLVRNRLDFSMLVRQVAFERFTTLYPGLIDKSEDDVTVPEHLENLNVVRALEDEIVDAKYKSHPNWLRVVALFDEAKTQLLTEAQKLPIGTEQRDFITKQLTTITLSLPYPDPNRTSSDADCAATTLNAFYDPSRHVYTVCAGLFNASQSKTALYLVTAHEMSHSFDAGRTATYFQQAKSPIYKALAKLIGMTNQSVFSNEDWRKTGKEIVSAFKPLQPQNYNALEKLYRCLAPQTLQPYSPKTAQTLAFAAARSIIGGEADSDVLLYMTEPNYQKNGVTKQSEYFLHPDVAFEAINGFLPGADFRQDPEAPAIYVQDLMSRVQSDQITAADALTKMTDDERATALTASTKNTTALLASYYNEEFSYCGKNCDELAAYQLAASPNEAFADWMAGKVITQYLTSLINNKDKDLDKARTASGLTMALFCDRPGPGHDSPLVSCAQKKFSLEPHPENRVRRISIYSPATSDILKCDVKAGEEGFGSCVP